MLTAKLQTPWQVWVKTDGTLSIPREATREDLLRLGEQLIDMAAWGSNARLAAPRFVYRLEARLEMVEGDAVDRACQRK